MASGAPHEESSLDLLPSPPGLRPCEGTAVLVGKQAPKSRVSQSLQQTRKSSKHEVSCFCVCRQPLLAPPHQGPAQSSRTPCANPASPQHIVFADAARVWAGSLAPVCLSQVPVAGIVTGNSREWRQ